MKASDFSFKHEPGVFLDGVKLTPRLCNDAPVLQQVMLATHGPTNYYRFPVGQWMLEYFVCPESTVEIDSSRYLTLQQNEDEDVVDQETGCVIFVKTVSQRCTFLGQCELTNVMIAESHLEGTDISLSPGTPREFNIYVRLEAIDCRVHDATLTNDTVLVDCWFDGVEIISRAKEPVNVSKCELQFSKFISNGLIDLRFMGAFNTHINMEGLIKIQSVFWSKVRITGQSIHIPGAMFFLEVTLPRVRFFVYQTAEDKWSIAPDLRGDRYSIDVDDPGLEGAVESVLQDRAQIDPQSCLQYLYDCIKSRNTVLENIGRFQEKLGRANI